MGTKADNLVEETNLNPQVEMARMEEAWKRAFPSDCNAPHLPADGDSVKKFHQVSARMVRNNHPDYQQSFHELVSAIIKSVESQRRTQLMRVIAGMHTLITTLESMARAGFQVKRRTDAERWRARLTTIGISFAEVLIDSTIALQDIRKLPEVDFFAAQMLLFVNQRVQAWENNIELGQQSPSFVIEEFFQICNAFLSKQPAKSLFDVLQRRLGGPRTGAQPNFSPVRVSLDAAAARQLEGLLSLLDVDFEWIFSQLLRNKMHKLGEEIIKNYKSGAGSPEWVKEMLLKMFGMVDFKTVIEEFLDELAGQVSWTGLLAWKRYLASKFNYSDELGTLFARNLSTKELDAVLSRIQVINLKVHCLRDKLSVGALKFENTVPDLSMTFQDICNKPIPVFFAQYESQTRPELAMAWLYDTTQWTDCQRKSLWTSVRKVNVICATEPW